MLGLLLLAPLISEEGLAPSRESLGMGTRLASFLKALEAYLQSSPVAGLKGLIKRPQIGSKRSGAQSIFITQGFSSGGFMRVFELHLTTVH